MTITSEKVESKDKLMEFIDELPGLSSALKKRVYKTLIEYGITHPLAFKNRTVKELESLDGISGTVAEKIVDKANPTASVQSLFKSLEEKKEEEKNKKLISTGSKRLDELLGGGVPLGTFVEFYGAPQSGKTQICYTISAHTLLPEEYGGLNAGILWLDTEGSFNSKRLEQIITYLEYKYKIPEGTVKTDKFKVATIRTLAQLEIALQQAEGIIPQHNVKLLIVDSLMDIFRAEYGGLGELAERQKHLNVIIHKMMKLADAYNVAVVYTNQVMANPDPFATALDKVQPVGGFILGHASDIRVWLRRATSATKKKYEAPTARRAMITDCGWLPMDETFFSIGALGICDVEEESVLKELAEKLFKKTDDELVTD
ncbi:MAG: AAA family ATPase [Candidatus Heimdallarchaeaceae archaeon]